MSRPYMAAATSWLTLAGEGPKVSDRRCCWVTLIASAVRSVRGWLGTISCLTFAPPLESLKSPSSFQVCQH